MRLVFIFLLSLFISQHIFSQANADPTFLTIGNQKVSAAEFERIYNKNNSISTTEKQTVDEYLQMFLNFKLKVQAAEDAGYDTLNSFKTELKGYRDQLAKSYLTDNSAIDSLVMEAYQRMNTEVNASHIMVSLKINPSPADTLEAWNKIMSIRRRLMNGDVFEKLAFELSDDPSAKNNKGNLGYFTAFQMVYPFESAVFNTQIGEISQPVRTMFGYHLIKTFDKRPAQGEVKVAHIMLMVPQGSPDSAWITAGQKIKDIRQQLKAGADFANLAKELSQDRGSAKNGGELPPFGTGRMIPEFEAAAFKLQFPGDISEPVRTFYGWHIIKLIEKKGIPEFDLVKQDLKTRIAKDDRMEIATSSFIARLKKEYNFSENPILLSELYISPLTSAKQTNKKVTTEPKKAPETAAVSPKQNLVRWNIEPAEAEKELFSFAHRLYKLADFTGYLKTIPLPDSTVSAETFVKKNYKTYVRNILVNYENSQLENKYADFKNLVQEYHDGILLFNLSDSLVWSKASKDSAGLRQYYEKNKSSYTWPERLQATIVISKTPQVAREAVKMAGKIKKQAAIETDLPKALCDSAAAEPCISTKSEKFIKGENPLIDSIQWKKGISPIVEIEGTSQFAVVFNLLKPMPRKLEEARGSVISDYQNDLENDWVINLRKKYNISVNNEILNQLKTKYAGKN